MAEKLIISPAVFAKLQAKNPPVSTQEIKECFATRTGQYLIDTREKNQTNPFTRWFISETYYGRKLKVVFVPRKSGIYIKTAYDPNPKELEIYVTQTKGTIRNR